MGMTMTQKILAAHAGLDEVKAGQLIEAELDMVMGNDVTTPPAIDVFRKSGRDKVYDRKKVALVPSHFTPNKDIKSAEQALRLRAFAEEQDLFYRFEQGKETMGIEHVVLPENGMIMPGDTLIGADSHTCTDGALGAFSTGVGSTDLGCAMATGKAWFKVPGALKFHLTGELKDPCTGKDLILYIISKIGVDGALYRSMEYSGPGVKTLSMADRMTVCNMAIEAGGKNGIFPVDDITLEYIKRVAPERYEAGDFTIYEADEDAEYDEVYEIDLSEIPLMVAFPHLPENGRAVGTFDPIEIDQVVIGSCTNGRIDDMRLAARFLKGRKVASHVRCIIIPGSQRVWNQCLKEGLFDIFTAAEAVISAPTCGPCLGGHMGVLAAGERCVSTTNRNFVGRMGHQTAEIYLAGPPVAASSAIMGRVAGPDELPEL
ncbi:MAG: 3-isopropylmalate dehydratase large subunit [Fastidiosipilaceae bacterium]|jgi:3-isopropylmalate/(R)-2-methylmalate dehydratase large subunit|nr:3-isopropylmalate dehydratase large subunit [Clostridiaceae bacterium]